MIAAARCCAWCLVARFMLTLAETPPCGPVDCHDLLWCWGRWASVHKVFAPSPLTVHCDVRYGGGWTLLQRRINSEVDFYGDWNYYKRGFGNSDSFWLGLDNLYRMTKGHVLELRIDVTFGGSRTTRYAVYDGVTFGNETAFYALNYSAYNGRGGLQDGLRTHAGPFCTMDSPAGYEHCQQLALHRHTGWWFGKKLELKDLPFRSDLNSEYEETPIYWIGLPRDISATEIKFRPSNYGSGDCDRSCPNGGTCFGAADGTFQCRCASGYTGRRCNPRPRVPAYNPTECFCFHSGWCVPDGSCMCPEGYTGSRCHILGRHRLAGRKGYRWVRLERTCR